VRDKTGNFQIWP